MNPDLARVSDAISDTILEFERCLAPRRTFQVEELRRFVTDRFPTIAPDSPGRILRAMRTKGLLDYRILNRRASLYQFADAVCP